jgi:hypothetical protein
VTLSTVENTGFADLKSDGTSASFTAKSKWVKPSGDVMLTDERRCVLTALPNGSRQLDISVKLIASAGKVTFRDTKEGTFALRVAPWLAVTGNKFDPKGGNGHILTSAGHKDTAAWGTRATWVSYYGPDPQGGTACITMMDHPSNLRHPTWWHVRDYGLFAANPFGISDFEASPDSPIKKGNRHRRTRDQGELRPRRRPIVHAAIPDSARTNSSRRNPAQRSIYGVR